MNCSRCGKPLEEDSRFCSACGKRAEDAETTKMRRLVIVLGSVVAVLTIVIICLLLDGNNAEKVPVKTTAADTVDEISVSTQAPVEDIENAPYAEEVGEEETEAMVPNPYHFSNENLWPAKFETQNNSFKIRFKFIYNADFVQEYVELLQDYGYTMEHCDPDGTKGWRSIYFTYQGDAAHSSFQCQRKIDGEWEDVDTDIWLRINYGESDDKGYADFDIRFADGLHLADTGERCSTTVEGPTDREFEYWDRVLDVYRPVYGYDSSSGGSSYSGDGVQIPEFARLDCFSCNGSGDCSRCSGSGYTGFGEYRAACSSCSHSGNCRSCGGSGKR